MAFIKRTLISCIWMLTLPLFSLHAQDDEEYRMELGGGLGGSFTWVMPITPPHSKYRSSRRIYGQVYHESTNVHKNQFNGRKNIRQHEKF